MKPTLDTYGGRLRDLGYAGQVATQNPIATTSLVNESATAIDFGVAVARGSNDKVCKPVSADTDKIAGISMRHAIRPAAADGTVNFARYDAVPLMREGDLLVTAFEAVTAGDTVIVVVAQGGKLGSSATAPGATTAYVGTGNGTITLDAATPVLADAKFGAYVATAIAAAANGGTFRVEAPDGSVLGDVAVGATFSDDVKFVINDGATDFVVGDKFTITVGAGRILLDGSGTKPKAVWETTTAAGAVGRIRVNS